MLRAWEPKQVHQGVRRSSLSGISWQSTFIKTRIGVLGKSPLHIFTRQIRIYNNAKEYTSSARITRAGKFQKWNTYSLYIARKTVPTGCGQAFCESQLRSLDISFRHLFFSRLVLFSSHVISSHGTFSWKLRIASHCLIPSHRIPSHLTSACLSPSELFAAHVSSSHVFSSLLSSSHIL